MEAVNYTSFLGKIERALEKMSQICPESVHRLSTFYNTQTRELELAAGVAIYPIILETAISDPACY